MGVCSSTLKVETGRDTAELVTVPPNDGFYWIDANERQILAESCLPTLEQVIALLERNPCVPLYLYSGSSVLFYSPHAALYNEKKFVTKHVITAIARSKGKHLANRAHYIWLRSQSHASAVQALRTILHLKDDVNQRVEVRETGRLSAQPSWTPDQIHSLCPPPLVGERYPREVDVQFYHLSASQARAVATVPWNFYFRVRDWGRFLFQPGGEGEAICAFLEALDCGKGQQVLGPKILFTSTNVSDNDRFVPFLLQSGHVWHRIDLDFRHSDTGVAQLDFYPALYTSCAECMCIPETCTIQQIVPMLLSIANLKPNTSIREWDLPLRIDAAGDNDQVYADYFFSFLSLLLDQFPYLRSLSVQLETNGMSNKPFLLVQQRMFSTLQRHEHVERFLCRIATTTSWDPSVDCLLRNRRARRKLLESRCFAAVCPALIPHLLAATTQPHAKRDCASARYEVLQEFTTRLLDQ